ncbi:MAG: stage V sporulation protein AE [Bacillota bacterium]
MKRRVIIITDGDGKAKAAVEKAARNVGGRCISLSSGNPSRLTGEDMVNLIRQTPYDPVLVMVDDAGYEGKGAGEAALKELIRHNGIEVLGILAVASNAEQGRGVEVDFSVTKDGEIIGGAVKKDGAPAVDGEKLRGDTVDTLRDLDAPIIAGIGDLGKMGDSDNEAQITTRAVEEILNRSMHNQQEY